MTENSTDFPDNAAAVAEAAAEAIGRGYQPVPVRTGTKRPMLSAWTHERYDFEGDLGKVRKAFAQFAGQGAENIGLQLGEPSGGLVDIDLDHPKTGRVKDFFLPPTPMKSGRPGRPASHYWYQVSEGTVPATRQYKMPDGSVIVELRSTGGQTLIPPSVHPSGEPYRWEGRGREWRDPAKLSAPRLQVQVAFTALGTLLVDRWPRRGSRHDAYLALAGGLLRYGDDVHPWWDRNAGMFIRIMAEATNDEDGGEAREREVIRTTRSRLLGEKGQRAATGWTRLGELIGEEHAEAARRLAFEIETLAGFRKGTVTVSVAERRRKKGADDGAPIAGQRDPLGERESAWERVDLGPYVRGEIEVQKPSVLRRDDGQGLLYPGRTNMLVAGTESGKTWIALQACAQSISDGLPVMYVDLEDGPAGTVERLKALGVGYDDIMAGFTYIHPDEPHADMQQNRWGRRQPTDLGVRNQVALDKALEAVNPRLVVVDGMSVLYGLHSLDTNDVTGTDVINGWLKSLVLTDDTTVVIIDHTGKGAQRGSQPIGSQHKLSMVQGACLQVFPVEKPRRGGTGELELIVIKDRPGWVRKVSQGREGHELAAFATVDSRQDDRTSIAIEPPNGDPDSVTADLDADAGRAQQVTQDAQLRDDVLELLAIAPEEGMSKLSMEVWLKEKLGRRFGTERWEAVIGSLVAKEMIEHNGKSGRYSRYTLRWT